MADENGEHWVGPSIKKSDLSFPLTLEKKIQIFEDRVIGWQLSIGLACYHKVAHGGFGALYITLSYFELYERYKEGSLGHQEAGNKFRDGFDDFAESIGYSADPNCFIVCELLYAGARCGLYHVGMTGKRVFIGGNRPCMFDYDSANSRLVIDADSLISAMITHFRDYTSRLRDTANLQIRSNFIKKFDHDILPQFA